MISGLTYLLNVYLLQIRPCKLLVCILMQELRLVLVGLLVGDRMCDDPCAWGFRAGMLHSELVSIT